MTNEATLAQNDAANPQVSTWLSANAGSGKTRVLTDRVARLLLRGTNPQSILCLTYTKAAASEMQNRLFQTLGNWSMLGDDTLRDKLAALGERPPETLSDARTLFARAIETPGGLKIQTIHSFCASILRLFPLEAGVSPQFQELDETGQKEILDTVLESLADDPAVTNIAHTTSRPLQDLASDLISKRHHFAVQQSPSDIYAHFDVDEQATAEGIMASTLPFENLAFLQSLLPALEASTSKTNLNLATAIHEAGQGDPYNALLSSFLTQSGTPRKTIATKDITGDQGVLVQLTDIAESFEQSQNTLFALSAAKQTEALHGFAHLLIPAYEAEKTRKGVLDFDDLINKTRDLLTSQSLSWVLYRLDGGLAHILVDEAQDTSPVQWQVIKALADEITAGQGVETQDNRTLFVVGDKKQSIYSFQGADARAFDAMGDGFEAQLRHGAGLKRRELSYSFRSSSAILTVVDAVLRLPEVEGVGDHIGHLAFKELLPGRVDLWPLIPRPETPNDLHWYDPIDRPAENDPDVVLANTIAENIRGLLDTGTIPDKNGDFRKVKAGDILILVQRRSRLFNEIIRACKAASLPIAGADRMKITGELAVRDLLALLSFIALPEDSLSLAAALRSPLFGWSEERLYRLAAGRKETHLWTTLRNRSEDHPDTLATLQDLRNRAEFDRPFELLERILTRHDGRRKLLARLGEEAEDAINELLNQSLRYEHANVPTLTGFLRQTQAEDIEVKRQSDTTGNLIRVMTVHGAKGLESPIVILPDTTRGERRQTGSVILSEDMPVSPTPSAESPQQVKTARDALRQAEREERNRLLYVAMTRAETWLITCGTENGGEDAINWHKLIETALKDCDAHPLETPVGPGLRFTHGTWEDTARTQEDGDVPPVAMLPAFLTEPAPEEKKPPEILNPSEMGGAKVLGGGAYDEDAAKRRGRQIHLLLEHPDIDPQKLLSHGPDAASPEEIEGLAKEAQNVRANLPDLFNEESLAEVDITAHIPTPNQTLSGTIDRLIITPNKIIAVDFKTNAITPDRPEDTPEGILRQMGAYLEALEQIWPDRPVEVAIVWTTTAEFMLLPHGIVRQALANTPTS